MFEEQIPQAKPKTRNDKSAASNNTSSSTTSPKSSTGAADRNRIRNHNYATNYFGHEALNKDDLDSEKMKLHELVIASTNKNETKEIDLLETDGDGFIDFTP